MKTVTTTASLKSLLTSSKELTRAAMDSMAIQMAIVDPGSRFQLVDEVILLDIDTKGSAVCFLLHLIDVVEDTIMNVVAQRRIISGEWKFEYYGTTARR